MVEINNQRKAFLGICWRGRGIDNGRQKTRNHGYDVIVGGEPFTDYSDHPRKLVTLNPKPEINRRWLPAFPVAGMPTALGLKDSLSEKSGRCGIAITMALTYDWSWWYPSGNRPLQQISGLHCRALVMVSSSIRLDSLIAKFKEAGGTVREIDVWAESPRSSPLNIRIIVCLSWGC